MPALRIVLVVLALYGFGAAAGARAGEKLVLSNTEARTILFFNASKEKVASLIPAGWTSNPASGPLAGANALLVLIEGIAADSTEGKPILHQGKSVVMVVPVKEEKTGAAAAMVVGGFVSEPQAAPGAYDVYVTARIAMAKSSRAEENGSTTMEESWQVSSDAGDTMRFAAAFTRGVGARAHVEQKVYAAVKPSFYRTYKIDQVTQIVHAAADESRRARRAEVSASGPQFGKLFDGSEKLVAVMSVPAYYRQVFVPE